MDNKDTYTHTRIRKEYLDKLQALAVRHKRSAMKELEVLIDEGERHDRTKGDSNETR